MISLLILRITLFLSIILKSTRRGGHSTYTLQLFDPRRIPAAGPVR
jgi:hypothetical protein